MRNALQVPNAWCTIYSHRSMWMEQPLMLQPMDMSTFYYLILIFSSIFLNQTIKWGITYYLRQWTTNVSSLQWGNFFSINVKESFFCILKRFRNDFNPNLMVNIIIDEDSFSSIGFVPDSMDCEQFNRCMQNNHLERTAIVCTVSNHGHNIIVLLETDDNLALLLRPESCKNRSTSDNMRNKLRIMQLNRLPSWTI